jgi:hypothetical protein
MRRVGRKLRLKNPYLRRLPSLVLDSNAISR